MEYDPCLQDGKRPTIKDISRPDGVEAWCIALAACLINFIIAGIGRMSGILYVEFIDTFHVDRREASLPFSIRTSVRNLLGPIVGILGQKYGVRKITVIGGIIGTISTAVCFFLDKMVWITVIWGAINGIGISLITTLPQVIIGQHFIKYRTTASGIAFSGGCVGSLLLPVLLEYLLHTYEFNGTFLILSGIVMHTIPAGLILRKPSWLHKKSNSVQVSAINNSTLEQQTQQTENMTDDVSRKTIRGDSINCVISDIDNSQKRINNGSYDQSLTSVDQKSSTCHVDVEFLRMNEELVIHILTGEFSNQTLAEDHVVHQSLVSMDVLKQKMEDLYVQLESYQCSENEKTGNQNTFTKDSLHFENKRSYNKPVYSIDGNQFYIGKEINSENLLEIVSDFKISQKLYSLSKSNKSQILSAFPEDTHEVLLKVIKELNNAYLLTEGCRTNLDPYSNKITNANENTLSEEESNSFMVHIKTAFRIHTNPLFLLICLCRSVHLLTFVPVVTTIVDFSMDKGLLEEDGKYVIAALSLGDLAGRLGLGWITDHNHMSLPRYMLLVMILQGVSTISLAWMESRASLMITLAVFALLQGSVFVRHPVLVSKYMASHEQSIAMGCINFFSGILGFALPSYIGYFRDTIGSYNGIFYINGAIGAFVGLLWIFEPFVLKCTKSNRKDAAFLNV